MLPKVKRIVGKQATSDIGRYPLPKDYPDVGVAANSASKDNLKTGIVMTVQELVEWCKKNNVSLDTPIALRAKDDYFLVEAGIYLDRAYFGNSAEGSDWEKKIAKVVDGDIDYDSIPSILILDSFSG